MATASNDLPELNIDEVDQLASQIAREAPPGSVTPRESTPRTAARKNFRGMVRKTIQQIRGTDAFLEWAALAREEIEEIAKTTNISVNDLDNLKKRTDARSREIYKNLKKYVNFAESLQEGLSPQTKLSTAVGTTRMASELGAIAVLARGIGLVPDINTITKAATQGLMAPVGGVTGWLGGLTDGTIKLLAGFGNLMYPAYSGMSAIANSLTQNELVSIGLMVALGLIYYRDEINNILGIGQEMGKSTKSSTTKFIDSAVNREISEIEKAIDDAKQREAELLAGEDTERKEMIQMSLELLKSNAAKLNKFAIKGPEERAKALYAVKSALTVLSNGSSKNTGLKKLVKMVDGKIARIGQHFIDKFNELQQKYAEINEKLNNKIDELDKIYASFHKIIPKKGLSDSEYMEIVDAYIKAKPSLSDGVDALNHHRNIQRIFDNYKNAIKEYNALIKDANELKKDMVKFGFEAFPGSFTAMTIINSIELVRQNSISLLNTIGKKLKSLPRTFTLFSAVARSIPKNAYPKESRKLRSSTPEKRNMKRQKVPTTSNTGISAMSTTGMSMSATSATSATSSKRGGSASRRKSSRRQSKTVRRKSVRKNPSKKRSSKKTRRRR